jgi:hypothetical protein
VPLSCQCGGLWGKKKTWSGGKVAWFVIGLFWLWFSWGMARSAPELQSHNGAENDIIWRIGMILIGGACLVAAYVTGARSWKCSCCGTSVATHNRFGDSVGTLVWGVIFIIGACMLWHCEFGNPFDELALIRRAQIAQGFVVDTWEDAEEGVRGGPYWSHGARYTYRIPDGREFTERTNPRPGQLKEVFRDLEKPYPIEVEYLPDNPAVSRGKGDGCQSVIEWLWRTVGLGSFLLVMFLAPGIVLIHNGLRDIGKLRTNS